MDIGAADLDQLSWLDTSASEGRQSIGATADELLPGVDRRYVVPDALGHCVRGSARVARHGRPEYPELCSEASVIEAPQRVLAAAQSRLWARPLIIDAGSITLPRSTVRRCTQGRGAGALEVHDVRPPLSGRCPAGCGGRGRAVLMDAIRNFRLCRSMWCVLTPQRAVAGRHPQGSRQ